MTETDPDQAYFVYVTAGDADKAKALGRALVEERLVACVNLLGGITSIYRWDGKVAEDTEVAMIAKTTGRQLDAVIARIQALHDYETPCIVAWPIAAGNPAFLDWIAASIR